MDIADIRTAAHCRPFRRFWLCLKDGSAVEVAHSDFIAFSPTGRTVAVDAESSHLLDVSAIQRLEYDPGTEKDRNVEAIRAALQATPFRPFRIRLADGRTYPVPQPEYAYVTPGGQRVVFCRPEDDLLSVLEPPFLRAIEFLDLPIGTGS